MKETLVPCCWTRRCERERSVESFSFFWCWTCGYERERVLESSSCFEKVKEEIRCCCVGTREEERDKNKEKGIGKEEKGLNLLVQPRKAKGEGFVGHVC